MKSIIQVKRNMPLTMTHMSKKQTSETKMTMMKKTKIVMKMTSALMVIIITMKAKMNIMIVMINVMLKTAGDDVQSVDEYGDEEDESCEEVDNNNYGEIKKMAIKTTKT